jgi:hypothetical protein
MKINRSTNESIILTQVKYVRNLLIRHDMKECSFVLTSIIEIKLTKSSLNYVCDKIELKEFQTLLRELMHLMMQTRSNIAYFVSRLTQFMINSANEHWTALKRVLRYLQDIKNLRICYQSMRQLAIEIWFDSSWEENSDDSRSINDHVIFMTDVFISWKLSKQQSIALSSIEVEYVSQTLTSTQIMWIRDILTEMSIEQVILSNLTIIYADNQKAIKLANNSIFQKRIKHIVVKYHYIRDLIKHENVELSYKSID